CADGVMGIFGPESMEEILLKIRFTVPIRVFNKNKIRGLGKVNATVSQLKTQRKIKTVCKNTMAICDPVFIGIFKDNQLIIGRYTWGILRIRRHGSHPQSPLRIKGD